MSQDTLTLGQPQAKPVETQISDAEITQRTEEGKLVPLGKDDLTPLGESNPYLQQAIANHTPIYVVPNEGSGITAYQEIRHVTTDKGNSAFIVTEGYHKWTPEYVREHVMAKDDEIKTVVNRLGMSTPDDFRSKLQREDAGSPESAARLERYQQFADKLAREEGDMGTAPTHIYIGDHDSSSRVTKEGTSYLFIDEKEVRAALNSPSNEKMDALLDSTGHELSHLKNKDGSAEGLVKSRGNLNVSRENEMRADLEGSGPLGGNDPLALKNSLQDELRAKIPEYLQAHPDVKMPASPDALLPKVSEWQYDRVQDPHPSLQTRIDALDEESKLKKQYEDTHTVTTHDQRVAESNAIIGQVMQDMQEKISHESSPLSPPPKDAPHLPPQASLGLNDDQLTQIQGMRNVMNLGALTHLPEDTLAVPNGTLQATKGVSGRPLSP